MGPLTASATGVGPGLSKLTAFNEALSVASESDSLPALHHLVHNFFTETAVLKYGLYDTSAGLNKMFGASLPSPLPLPRRFLD